MAQVPQIRVVQAMETPQVRRRLRQPSVKFNLQTEPYAIAPFFIHPVRPGETMTNLLLQSRVVSDPINNALIEADAASGKLRHDAGQRE